MTDKACIVWFTGLPSAGKTTLAAGVAADIRDRGARVELLDGDAIRRTISAGLGFTREDRDENVRRVGVESERLLAGGAFVMVALVSPYRAARDEVRRKVGRFVEVFVSCPVEACIRRDVKGYYREALAGGRPHFTGVSDPYEEPLHPEVVVETEHEGPEQGIQRVVRELEALGYLIPRIPPHR